MECRDLRGASRGRSVGGGRRPLYRCHAFGAARTRRAVVLRRILRDLASAAVTKDGKQTTETEDENQTIRRLSSVVRSRYNNACCSSSTRSIKATFCRRAPSITAITVS